MDIRASQAPAPLQTQLCTACSGLNLRITDFFNTNASDIRIDAWGTFRKARLGTFADLNSRPTCPICCLAVKVILLKSTVDVTPEDLTQYEVCLRWEDPVWDKEVMKVRRPVFLGFSSDYDRFDIQFVPSLLNAAYGGASTIQYSSRHLQTVGDKCGLVRQWLETCLNNHGSTCSRIRGIDHQQAHVWNIPNFILIDVHTQCLVDAPVECRYAALSYVWGRHPFMNLTKANVTRLRQPGSLKEHVRLLPKTISDSIDFIRQIGERYLWVDSLCIVQDDKDQKHGLIDNMDLIFSGALLTIIAATGSDSNSGLFHRRGLQQTVTQGLDLTGIDFFQSKRGAGEWFHEARGWTYQEQLLSNRQVVFANGLTFFVCSKSVWREDLVTEETDVIAGEGGITKHFHRPLQSGQDPAAAISSYVSCVEAYSCRELSYVDDGLNAFAGISKILESDLGTTLFYGLPVKYFELALLWSPKANLARREGFPSWSWAGWSGPVDISSVRRASDFVRLAGVFKTRNIYEYYEPALIGFWPLDGLSGSTAAQSVKFDPIKTYIPDRLKQHDHFGNKPGLVQIERAQCATFNIALFEPEQRTNYRSNLGILDTDDNLIGELEDGHELQLESLPNLLGVHEVVVISEKHSEPWHYELFPSSYRSSDTPLRPSGSAGQLKPRASGSSLLSRDSPHIKSVRSRLDMKMHKASDWNLFNVMVIEWRDGIAYRLGVGWIFKESLAKSLRPGRNWKTIMLG
ncbi:HET-domain-containing protein [Stipitochalara longipes BDJ]|nr:HET-domain-containing protein [Stipitochalara longipes BDJ]